MEWHGSHFENCWYMKLVRTAMTFIYSYTQFLWYKALTFISLLRISNFLNAFTTGLTVLFNILHKYSTQTLCTCKICYLTANILEPLHSEYTITQEISAPSVTKFLHGIFTQKIHSKSDQFSIKILSHSRQSVVRTQDLTTCNSDPWQQLATISFRHIVENNHIYSIILFTVKTHIFHRTLAQKML